MSTNDALETFTTHWQFPATDCVAQLIISGPGRHPSTETMQAVIQFCEIANGQMARIEEPARLELMKEICHSNTALEAHKEDR